MYQEWQKAQLDVSEMPKELQGIYRTLNQHHTNNDNHSDISLADLSNLYFASRPREREFAIRVFDQLERVELSGTTTSKLITSIRIGKLLRELSLSAYEAAESRKDISSVLAEIKTLQETAESGVSEEVQVSEDSFVTDDLEILVNDSIKTPGLRWRLGTLNKMLGSLRVGDFGFIFARPETGKTTFLASEVTHMATQATGPILWFNNEEQGSKVMLRCYQASLGITLTELFTDIPTAKAKFHELTHGNIKIIDSASITKQYVEKLCAKWKPSLIIFDQIDKIKGFDNDREDLRLGSIYQWGRELAKTYAPVIGVCQADGSGEGQRWLTMANVANAKTSKQAEADWILGIGKVNEMGYDTIRYLHLSKNKLIGDSDTQATQRHGRMEVLIEADVARYKDLQ